MLVYLRFGARWERRERQKERRRRREGGVKTEIEKDRRVREEEIKEKKRER